MLIASSWTTVSEGAEEDWEYETEWDDEEEDDDDLWEDDDDF